MSALSDLQILRNEAKLVERITSRLEGNKAVITLKKHPNTVYVGEIAKVISIPERVAYAMQFLAPVAKRYHNCTPQNGLEYIRYCGGFKKAIGKLYDLHHFADGILESSDYNVFFWELLLLYQSLEGAAKQSYKRRYSIADPICCFCWREVKKGKNYCYEHHPSFNELGYKKVRNHLLRFFSIDKSRFSHSDLIIEIKKHLRNYLPQLDERHVKGDEKLSINWKFKAKKLLEESSRKYPLTYSKIRFLDLDSYEQYADYCVAVLTNLSGKVVTEQDTDYINRCNNNSVWEINMELAYILKLHESHSQIMSQKLKTGPKSGSMRVSTNEKIERLQEILKNQIQVYGKTNLSEAARVLSVSRQYVSKLVKSL